jgi:hypothetical protein
MAGPVSMTASFDPLVTVTVTTAPAGRTIMVDATTYTAPQTFQWVSGSSHTISTGSTQSGGAGTRYLWSNWNDGGAATHVVTPTASTTYTANFVTQYLLSTSSGSGGDVTIGGWHDSGANVQVTATPISGFMFANWTGTGVGSYTGADNPASVSMFGPISMTANFATLPVPSPTPTVSPSPTPSPVSDIVMEGQVLTSDGRGLRGATVTLIDANGISRTAITSSLGYFSFDDVKTGQSVTVTISSKRYRFTVQTVPIPGPIAPLTLTGVE